MKEHFLGAAFDTIIRLSLYGFTQHQPHRLMTGAVVLQPFTQFRHAVGPFAMIKTASFGIKASEASSALAGLRLINLFDKLRMRRCFSPAPVSRGEIVLCLI